ncbi:MULTISPECIES: hypothetical protein [Pseudomonas]|uniref:hypothetical protein n=1 Tax=Pseudomonas TaxID=286 RepID=UPI000D6FC69C|nr:MULTISPECIES: hypothetical protein [unclassified Pseudomonas]PWU29567.1 hypothetical protein DK254_15725 [Pseudomonas sp. RW407]
METQQQSVCSSQGICFALTRIRLQPHERNRLRLLRYSSTSLLNQDIADFVTEVFDYMQVKNRECSLEVALSEPLTRQLADALNTQNLQVALTLSSIAGALVGFGNKVAGVAAGGAVRKYARSRLRNFHSGDRILSVAARVSGGIGPQATLQSTLITRARPT